MFLRTGSNADPYYNRLYSRSVCTFKLTGVDCRCKCVRNLCIMHSCRKFRIHFVNHYEDVQSLQ